MYWRKSLKTYQHVSMWINLLCTLFFTVFLHRKLSEQLEFKHRLLSLTLSVFPLDVIQVYCKKNGIGLKFTGSQGKSTNRYLHAKFIKIYIL